MRRLGLGIGLLTVTAVLAFNGGFVAFVAAAHRAPELTPEADGIVVLTGGADRVETGLHLLAADRGRLLLVSGVARGATLGELLHRAGLEVDGIGPRVTLGRTATTTVGNAEETADWARAHQLHSLIVVTAGFHMPRALLELRRAMPKVAFYPLPVQPTEPGGLGSLRLLYAEYAKLLAAWAGVAHLLRQPVTVTWQHPVHMSVSSWTAFLPKDASRTGQGA